MNAIDCCDGLGRNEIVVIVSLSVSLSCLLLHFSFEHFTLTVTSHGDQDVGRG